MNIDEYKDKVIELLRSGDEEALRDAAACVLYCSECLGVECSCVIDTKLGVFDERC